MEFFTKARIEENINSKTEGFWLFPLESEFPTISAVSKEFIKMVEEKKQEKHPLHIAEIGVGVGVSSREVCKLLGSDDTYYCFDFDFAIQALVHDLELLKSKGEIVCNIVGKSNTDRTYDSYGWSLSQMLLDMRRNHQEGIFDIAYLDGAHTLFHDGLACCLVKEMMKPNGYLVLDDIHWCHAKSPTQDIPELLHHFTEEQLKECQMQRIEELFLRYDPSFEKISEDTAWRAVYRKVSGKAGSAVVAGLNGMYARYPGIRNWFETARIDVKNMGTAANDVKIETVNEAKCQISKPAWFSKDGSGYVAQTRSQHVKWKITCIKNGTLKIWLRGIDQRDAAGKRIPMWVDYLLFSIDGKTLFSSATPAWHDKPYSFFREVKDGDVLDVEIRWKPHVYSDSEILGMLYSQFSAVAKNALQRPMPDISTNFVPEIHWSQIYHDTIIGSEWLLDKAVSPGGPQRWAVGYNFLYALYRILDEMHPKHILELGLGQSTKLTGQYARYFGAMHEVVEHDQEWVDFFCHGWKKLSPQTRIYVSPLVEREFDGQKYFAYRDFDKIVKNLNAPCELILVDGPFGGRSERSRRDILAYLPKLLSKDFVIMVDDCGRKGELNLLQEIKDILGRNHIEYAFGLYKSGGDCHVGVIACKKWKFFTTM